MGNELSAQGDFDREITEPEAEAFTRWLCELMEVDVEDYDTYIETLDVNTLGFRITELYWDDFDVFRWQCKQHLPEDVTVTVKLFARFDEAPTPDMYFIGPHAEEAEIKWCDQEIYYLMLRKENAEVRRQAREAA